MKELSTCQYGISFPSEYTIDLVTDVAKTMNIPFDINKLKDAMNNNGVPTEKTLCIFKNPSNDNCFIMVDCLNADYLYGICIRCSHDINEQAKKKLLEWDTKVREEYGQPIQDDLVNSINNEKSIYISMVRRYNLTSHIVP